MSTANRRRRSTRRFLHRYSIAICDRVFFEDSFLTRLKKLEEHDEYIKAKLLDRSTDTTWDGGTFIEEMIHYGPNPE